MADAPLRGPPPHDRCAAPRDAEETGRLLAEHGAVVVCGGFEGVMCAAARGARAGGGISIGLLAGDDVSAAADEVTIALPTGLGELSNAVLPRIAGGMIAIGSGYGTLSEVSHAVKLGRPVVSIGSWEVRPPAPTVSTPPSTRPRPRGRRSSGSSSTSPTTAGGPAATARETVAGPAEQRHPRPSARGAAGFRPLPSFPVQAHERVRREGRELCGSASGSLSAS